MFVPFARPLFACHRNNARPRTFLSVYKFRGDNIFVHQSPFTQSQQPVFQINDDMVLAHHFVVEIEFFHCMTRTYIVESFHRQFAFQMEFIGIWKKSLSFHWPFSCSVFMLLDIQTFYYHKTHKKNSNYVAVLVFTCCAAPISLRVVYVTLTHSLALLFVSSSWNGQQWQRPWSVKMYVSRLILWCITFLQN